MFDSGKQGRRGKADLSPLWCGVGRRGRCHHATWEISRLCVALLGLSLAVGGWADAASPDGDKSLIVRTSPQPIVRTLPPESIPHPPLAGGDASRKIDVLEFRDIPLEGAIRAFSEQVGLNIVASPEARKTQISLYLRNVTPEAALDALCKANDLWYREDPSSGIIRIYTTKEYQRDLTSFREEQTEVFTLLYPNPVDVATAIRSIYGDRVVLSLQSQSQDVYEDLTERFDRFDLVDERSQGLGYFSSSNGSGGTSSGTNSTNNRSSSNRGNGSSGSTGRTRRQDLTTDSRLARQDAKTKQIPTREEFKNLTPEQILTLEADATGEGKVDKGVLEELLARRRAAIYVTVIRQHNQLIVRTSDEKTMQQIRDLVKRVDTPTPLVLLEVKILQVDLKDDFTSAFDYQFSDGHTVAGGFTTGNILPPVSDNPARISSPYTRRDSTLVPEGLTDSNGGPNRPFTFQFVNDNFRFRMQLLENNNRVTTLATPLLLTANNEVSRLFVGEEVPLNRTYTGPTPITNANGSSNTYAAGSTDIEFRPVGVTLLITPNINADRTVTLRVLQEVSEIAQNGANILIPTDTGFTEQSVDTVKSRTVSGTVVGMDGLTVAIGGLIREQVSDSRAEVPILGKLPVIGFFFRSQESLRSRNELIILIRPYVFSTPAESAASSEELVQDLSIHPKRCDPKGSMNTFAPHEALRANPPANECQKIFRFHSLEPKRY
jgi:general secretion pathway protein D